MYYGSCVCFALRDSGKVDRVLRVKFYGNQPSESAEKQAKTKMKRGLSYISVQSWEAAADAADKFLAVVAEVVKQQPSIADLASASAAEQNQA